MKNLSSNLLNFLWLLLFLLIPMAANADAQYSIEPTAKVISSKKLNMRSGPGTNYGVIYQLAPGSYVSVIDTAYTYRGWTEVRTQNGIRGYVADSYLSADYRFGFDDNPQEDSGFKFSLPRLDTLAKYHKLLYHKLLDLELSKALMWLLIPAFLALGLILGMKWAYLDYDLGPEFAYIVLFFSSVITLPMLVFFEAAFVEGWSSAAVYYSMLFPMTCLMLHAAWRVKLCGMSYGRHIKESGWGYFHFQMGRGLANIFTLIVLCAYINLGNHLIDLLPVRYDFMRQTFWHLLLSLIVLSVIVSLYYRCVWPFIVQYLLQSVNQSIVYIMSLLVSAGMIKYLYDVFYANTFNLSFIFTMCYFYVVALFLLAKPITIINSRRCARCHSFSTTWTGREDLGYETKVKTYWRDIDEKYIDRRISHSEIEDPQELVERTEVEHQWNDNFRCYNCDNEWSIFGSKTVSRSYKPLKREWTERY